MSNTSTKATCFKLIFIKFACSMKRCQYAIPVPSHHHNCLRPFFRDHLGDPVPEENFWTLWCKGRLTEADTQTIRLGATPSGLTSAHLHHPPCHTSAYHYKKHWFQVTALCFTCHKEHSLRVSASVPFTALTLLAR